MMIGVVMFSMIISQYIEIILDYQELMRVGHHRELSQWMNLLSRFNNGVPIGKSLMSQIESFFDFYWEFNRLSCVQDEIGKRFMTELPNYVIQHIYIDYLFQEFLYKYKTWFFPRLRKKIAKSMSKLKY